MHSTLEFLGSNITKQILIIVNNVETMLETKKGSTELQNKLTDFENAFQEKGVPK